MGSVSTGLKSFAAGGALIALIAIAACGSSGDARTADAALATEAAASSRTAARIATVANDAIETTVSSVPAPAGAKSATLCAAGETPFFSCEIGTKRVSVCGAGTGAGAVYRYGTAGKVELTTRNLTFANRAYSGGGESQVTATNGEYSYTVFDRTVRTSFDAGGNDPAFSSGLIVGRSGKMLSTRMCKGESRVKADAERALPAGTFVEH